MSEAYALVIDIPEATNNCFVAFPFKIKQASDHPITQIIDEAARRAKLAVPWIDWERPGVDILDTIHAGIKSCKLFVAVCGPVAGVEPNRNVLYELGYATALGKATLVMTTNASSLPFDIQGRKAFEYDDSELKGSRERESLMNRLGNGIHQILQCLAKEAPITLADLPGIYVVKGDKKFVLQPEFWIYARGAFQFARKIRDGADPLIRHWDYLAGVTQRMTRHGRDDRVDDFLRTWRIVEEMHRNLIARDMRESDFGNVNDKLASLRQRATGAEEFVKELGSRFEELHKKAKAYQDAVAKAQQSADQVRRTLRPPDSIYADFDPVVQVAALVKNSASDIIDHIEETVTELIHVLKC
jgi:hypothetical protein